MRATGVTFGTVLVVLATAIRSANATVQDANETLGFESTGDWTVQNGVIAGTSSVRSQGNASLAVHASGYTVLQSRLLGPLGQVSPKLSFDLYLPDGQSNSGWAGATQLFVSVPSQGLYNAYLGQVELTGLNTNQFNRVEFNVPGDVLSKLRSNYYDLSFSIALNVPQNDQSVYLLDNLEVSSTIPPYSTVGANDRLPILQFETLGWQLSGGSIVGLSATHKTQGNFSLAFRPQGYSVMTSRPMPSIGPVDPVLAFDLWQPTDQPNPYWYGAVQLYVTIPSQGVNNAYLGQADLTSLPVGKFNTLNFPVPTWLIPSLNATYSDLEFSIAFNVPTNATGIYYVDNFRIGALTTPPALLPLSTPIREDLVGLASSGFFNFGIDDDSATPGLSLGVFYAEEVDHGCVPTSLQACRFIVHLTKFRTGGFSLKDADVSAATLINLYPFEVVLGGNGPDSLSSPIPSNVPFVVNTEGQNFAFNLFADSNSSITLSPAGSGMIAMSAQFRGSIDDHGVFLNMSVTADSPLANRPPLADAGSDRIITTNSCVAIANLSASNSSDPDNNIRFVRWYEGNVLSGTGFTPNVTIQKSGTHVFTAVAEDFYGSQSRDDVSVTVNMPSTCHHP